MGSEMCIRDRGPGTAQAADEEHADVIGNRSGELNATNGGRKGRSCTPKPTEIKKKEIRELRLIVRAALG